MSPDPQSGKIRVGGYATRHAGAGVVLLDNLNHHHTEHRFSQSGLHLEVRGREAVSRLCSIKGRQVRETFTWPLGCLFESLTDAMVVVVFLPTEVPTTGNPRHTLA